MAVAASRGRKPNQARERTVRTTARFALLVGALAICACSNSSNDDSIGVGSIVNEWTMLAHDLSSTYHNPAETKLSSANVKDLKLAWKLETRGPVNGAAAIRDGVVYILSSGGAYAVNAADGSVIWENTAVGGTASVTISEDTLFVNTSRAAVVALDAATGAERWRSVVDPHPAASGYSSPVVFERFVIVGSSSFEEAVVSENARFRGAVVAFDRDTGAELWRYYTADPPYNGVSVWSTVSIDPDLRSVYASTGNNYTEQAGPTSDAIFSLDVDTGALKWVKQLTEGDIFTILNPQSPDTDFGTNPILFDARIGGTDRQLLGAGQKSGVFWVLDRTNGEVIWSQAVSPGSALIGGMLNNGAYDGERLIVAGSNGSSDSPGSEPPKNGQPNGPKARLAALDPVDGHIIWDRQIRAWVWAPLTIANGVAFVGVDTDLDAVDATTGQRLFTFPTTGTITSAPAVADGRVYFGSGLSYFVGENDNAFYALSLEGGGGDGGGGGGGGDAITFTAIYDDIFVTKGGCNTTSCHGGNQGNLNMSTRDDAYSNLVGVPASGVLCGSSGLVRVVPGDPGASLLLDKVSGDPPACGDPMPPANPLDAQDIERIRRWIADGAKDD
jgi:polyvinyl alcohol dehydrogenase (cytochrome)